MERIFISHSSRDGALAARLCDALENSGRSCWIAPRDISYGETWAEEIATELLDSTRLFVFLLSENSNRRPKQVLREINLAVGSDIPLLVFNIDNTSDLNRSFLYYFSTVHICTCPSGDPVETILQAVERKLNGGPDGSEEDGGRRSLPSHKRLIRVNVTKELDAKFAGLPALKREPDAPAPQKKLREIMWRNILNHWVEGDGDPPSEDPPPGAARLGAERAQEENGLTEPDLSHTVQGKYVQLHDRKGQDTIIYQINRRIDAKSEQKLYKTERIDCLVEPQPDGSTEKYYFFDNPGHDGNPLLLITTDQSVRQTFVQLGFLDRDHIKILKSAPHMMSFANCGADSDEICRFLAEKEHDYVIIDPEIPEPVEPYTETDPLTGKAQTFIDLVPGKKYHIFKLNVRNVGRASMAEVGIAYFWGENGLPKNNFLAAEHLLQSEEPEAAYYLGRIFSSDPLLRDLDLAKQYLGEAASNGLYNAEALLAAL